MIDSELENKLLNLPELLLGDKMWQNKYHEYDVYEHTVKYVEFLKTLTDESEMIVVGYLHDIGKPVLRIEREKEFQLRKDEKGYDVFEGHEKRGAQMIKEMDSSLFVQYNLDQDIISKFVGSHYIPMKHFLKMQEMDDWNDFIVEYTALNQELEETGLDKDKQMMLFLADSVAKGSKCEDLDEMFMFRAAIVNGNGFLEKLYRLQRCRYGKPK